MGYRRFWIPVLVVAVSAGAAVAQDDTPDVPTVPPPANVPCMIDESLSLWLALESVDRTIAALEIERRDLAKELAMALRTLDLLARADDPDDAGFAELTATLQANAIGRDAIEDTYAEVQNRLVDIDKTLTRRTGQQAMLESRLESLQRPSAQEPSAAE